MVKKISLQYINYQGFYFILDTDFFNLQSMLKSCFLFKRYFFHYELVQSISIFFLPQIASFQHLPLSYDQNPKDAIGRE